MKRWPTLLAIALALALGWLAHGWMPGATDAAGGGEGPCPGGAQPLHWKAPMDPTYVRDQPGKSPMGMDLVPVCPGGGDAEGSGIRIDPAVVQNIGVRTAPVERRDLARQVRAVGRVTYDERLVSHIHTKFQGWIERLYVRYEGERVERGQPLLEIYSPELVSTQEELIQAVRYRDSTAGSPFADVAEGGQALLRAARRRLELFDIRQRDIERLLETGEVRKTLTLYAPTEGVVTHLMAREGMEVNANDNLYTIADLSRVWVQADVYEYELPWVERGQQATVELSYLAGAEFEGEVTYVYPFLDPKTRTARVRVELPNPEGVLKPDMYANVTIDTRVLEDAVVVPDEAVIRSGRRSLVVVARGEGRFDPREVDLGVSSGDGWVQIEAGVVPGERIVTSGQFLIDSESRLRAAVQQMLASPAGEDAAAGDDGAGTHEGHDMSESHESHAMPESHEGHDMSGSHEGHAMPESHEGHDMSGSHEGHGMPESHEGHAMPGHDASATEP